MMNRDSKGKRLIWPWIVLAFAVVVLLTGMLNRGDPTAGSAPTDSPEAILNVFAPSPGAQPTTSPLITRGPTRAPTATPIPSITPYPLLQAGMDGEAVRAMQEELITLGYLAIGKADGDFGNGTREAVEAFQKVNKLDPDGIAGEKTLALLFGGHAKQTDDPFVWVEKNGKVYHSSPECSDMKNPYQIKLSKATKDKLTPCDKCN
jgi:peptidoglycan hydrolase-like protein with peptidoglycan-binding domain